MSLRQRRVLLLLAIALVVAAVTPWTDFVGHSHWGDVQWIPFVTPPIRAIDIVSNVVLFIPLGATVALNWPGRSMAAVGIWAFTLSFAGEWAQLYSHNRFPSSTDLLCNVAGALIGAHVYRSVALAERHDR